MAGPLFQPVRGILFGIAFYLLREPLFGKKAGRQRDILPPSDVLNVLGMLLGSLALVLIMAAGKQTALVFVVALFGWG